MTKRLLLSTATRAYTTALIVALAVGGAPAAEKAPVRPRVIVETDAGGDPDDEQSLVRFLLYSNDLDVEGIICNRREARVGENRNPERTGLGIVRRMVDAYAVCYPNLKQHDPRYPEPEVLRKRVVSGYEDSADGVDLIRAAVERRDPRPVWFLNWGTDHGADSSSLKRVLDQVLRERGPEGYARFKNRLRLSSDDQFEEHTNTIQPPFKLWVDTFRPEVERRRWYHRFSALSAKAGGFDARRDMLTGHGPLGAMYPLNTTHPQKEGDTMTFLYLVPTGMNDPEQPGWGSWAGRYGPNPEAPGQPYYWANQADTWQGTTHRENSLGRWAADLQNDFRARLDWCVQPYAGANHPPRAQVRGEWLRTVKAGREVRLDARESSDPDGQRLGYQWIFYPEAGTYRGALPELRGAANPQASFTAPVVKEEQTLHALLLLSDAGDPPLTRYRRVVVRVRP